MLSDRSFNLCAKGLVKTGPLAYSAHEIWPCFLAVILIPFWSIDHGT